MSLDFGKNKSTTKATTPKIRVASDGYPVALAPSNTWRGICTICFAPTATLTVTKRHTYKVSCAQCKCYVWLNDRVSIDLWRATQKLFKESPEVRDLLVSQVTANLPQD